MPRRISGIGAGTLKYLPFLAIVIAIWQYYQNAGGFSGFIDDIKNFSAEKVKNAWSNLAFGIGIIVAADIAARWVPGKLKYVVKAVMYYLGATQILSVLQGMYGADMPEPVISNGILSTGGVF